MLSIYRSVLSTKQVLLPAIIFFSSSIVHGDTTFDGQTNRGIESPPKPILVEETPISETKVVKFCIENDYRKL